MMLLQNEIECNHCHERIHSKSVHDFVTCECGNVSVDGGMDYMRRVGNDYTELSLHMDDALAGRCEVAIKDSLVDKRNALGILCAVMRTLRDGGVTWKDGTLKMG